MDYEKKAGSLRRTSVVFFAAAALFAVMGIVFFAMTGNPSNAITLVSAIILVGSGVSLRSTASSYDRMARRRY